MPVVLNSPAHPRRCGNTQSGYTLIDMMVTVLVMGIVMAMAAPGLRDFNSTFRLEQNSREVERVLQTARLKAVTANRPIRVRFNCPVAGSYRMVELLGTSSTPLAADSAADRCLTTSYPYPATDRNQMTLPNHDGPAQTLGTGVAFGAAKSLEFHSDGTVFQDEGSSAYVAVSATGTAITLTKGATVKTIKVNGLGKIELVR
jgi:prepilin-type N-terminal cleavage/methylation domain-containing protein